MAKPQQRRTFETFDVELSVNGQRPLCGRKSLANSTDVSGVLMPRHSVGHLTLSSSHFWNRYTSRRSEMSTPLGHCDSAKIVPFLCSMPIRFVANVPSNLCRPAGPAENSPGLEAGVVWRLHLKPRQGRKNSAAPAGAGRFLAERPRPQGRGYSRLRLRRFPSSFCNEPDGHAAFHRCVSSGAPSALHLPANGFSFIL